MCSLYFGEWSAVLPTKNVGLRFPEAVIVPVLARRADIELALIIAKGIMELRLGSDTPAFFVEQERENQHDWANDLAERTACPALKCRASACSIPA